MIVGSQQTVFFPLSCNLLSSCGSFDIVVEDLTASCTSSGMLVYVKVDLDPCAALPWTGFILS
jgi:hypothetical protein